MIQGMLHFMNNFSSEALDTIRGTRYTFYILTPEPFLLLILKVQNGPNTGTDEQWKAYLKRAWNWYFLLFGAARTSKSNLDHLITGKLNFFVRYLSFDGNQLSLLSTLPGKFIICLMGSHFFYSVQNGRLCKTFGFRN
jgi:hypothetical protein